MRRALVIGGTGPTGPYVVQGLRERGYAVTILHTGRHERSEIADDVEHVHVDPFDRTAVAGALAGRYFELGVVMYGRLRDLAEVLVGRIGRLVTIGGEPVVAGFADPEALHPRGMPVPTTDGAPLVGVDGGPVSNDKVAKMLESEAAVFAAHLDATHLRYPLVYGPHQLLPREWLVVRRILDGRRRIILPDGGLYLGSAVYVENAAAALLLCVDQPEATAGHRFHVSDDSTPTLRQLVEIIAAALGHELDIVDLPYELAWPAHPLMMRAGPFHRYAPAAGLQALGYRDRVPCHEGLAHTARWLVANPPERGGTIERNLQDPFDYAAEDALIDAWHAALRPLRAAAAVADPHFVDRYSPTRDVERARRRALRAARRQIAAARSEPERYDAPSSRPMKPAGA
jgi:nucleoside-diphosphate-sugar epimerase